MAWHLAQVNIGRLRAPVGDPLVADFVDGLDPVNAVADAAPGFVWRLQADDGNATSIRISDDPQLAINLSVWESVEALRAFVFRSGHVGFLRRRGEWFEPEHTAVAMWWVPAGHVPTVDEAMDRLDRLRADGPTADAFTMRRLFPAPADADS